MLPFVGEIKSFAGDFLPQGWLLCDGSSYSSSQYAALCSVITFGYQPMPATFKVPDLRGRVLIGAGKGNGLNENFGIGQELGSENVGLTSLQMPVHNHTAASNVLPITGESALNINVSDTQNISDAPSGKYIANSGSGPLYAENTDNSTLASDAIAITHNLYINQGAITTSNTGKGTPFSIVQPLQATIWMICYDGLYPPRT